MFVFLSFYCTPCLGRHLVTLKNSRVPITVACDFPFVKQLEGSPSMGVGGVKQHMDNVFITM